MRKSHVAFTLSHMRHAFAKNHDQWKHVLKLTQNMKYIWYPPTGWEHSLSLKKNQILRLSLTFINQSIQIANLGKSCVMHLSLRRSLTILFPNILNPTAFNGQVHNVGVSWCSVVLTGLILSFFNSSGGKVEVLLSVCLSVWRGEISSDSKMGKCDDYQRLPELLQRSFPSWNGVCRYVCVYVVILNL